MECVHSKYGRKFSENLLPLVDPVEIYAPFLRKPECKTIFGNFDWYVKIFSKRFPPSRPIRRRKNSNAQLRNWKYIFEGLTTSRQCHPYFTDIRRVEKCKKPETIDHVEYCRLSRVVLEAGLYNRGSFA